MPAGGLAELLLGRAPLLEQAVELLVAAAALGLRRGAPFRDLGEPAVEPLELGGREPRTRSSSTCSPSFAARSAAVAWSASGRRRLRTSVLEIARALDLRRDARELQLGAVAAALEPSKPGRLLHERAPLGRLGREDLLDAALAR